MCDKILGPLAIAVGGSQGQELCLLQHRLDGARAAGNDAGLVCVVLAGILLFVRLAALSALGLHSLCCGPSGVFVV